MEKILESLESKEATPMKLQATFYTMTGAIFAQGIYKSRRALRLAQDRYDNKYGAYLRVDVKEVA